MNIKRGFLFIMAFSCFSSFSLANNLNIGVYIWSNCFKKLKSSEITNFIETKDIERIELSYKPYSEEQSVRDWTKKITDRGKEVEIILSEPSYIFPEKWPEVRNRLIDIFESGHNVHFDIEPHILPDFKENKVKYLELFLNLLQKTNFIAKQYKKKLSVAISISHYKSVINEIFNNSDLVVFMAYGFKNVKRINRIIDSHEKEKVAIALRAKDFENEKELLEYIHEINNLTSIRIFIIQNLRQWKELR